MNVTISFTTPRKDAHESIEFLDRMYDETKDGFFNELANHYRHAVGISPRPYVHSLHTLLVSWDPYNVSDSLTREQSR